MNMSTSFLLQQPGPARMDKYKFKKKLKYILVHFARSFFPTNQN